MHWPSHYLLSSMYLKKRKISVVLKYITVIICKKLSNDFLHLEVPNVSLLSPKSSQLIISASSIPSLNTHNAWVRLFFFIIFISSSTLLRDIGSSSVLTTRPYRTSSSVDLGQGAVGIPRQGLAPGSLSPPQPGAVQPEAVPGTTGVGIGWAWAQMEARECAHGWAGLSCEELEGDTAESSLGQCFCRQGPETGVG